VPRSFEVDALRRNEVRIGSGGVEYYDSVTIRGEG
jgi:hypothetical protein